MDAKKTGLTLIGICIILLIAFTSLIDELNKNKASTCGCPANTCPMDSDLPIQAYIGIATALILGGAGLSMLVMSKKIDTQDKNRRNAIEKEIQTLNEDEKRIYEIIFRSDGIIFQSELVEKTDFPKAKISRLLDKLENRGLVERRRQGMSNLILLHKR